MTAIKSQIKAYANCDHVYIAWRYEQLIPNCIGFALYKRANGESEAAAEPVGNHIGFAGQDPKPGEIRPSTDWPIQRFTWTDYDVKPDDTVSYMVLPICWNGTSVEKDSANVSPWSETVSVSTGKDIEAYFNRGIISSQFMSRQMDNLQTTDKKATLADTLQDPDSAIRKFLGGVLAEQLFNQMDAVIKDKTLSIYAALYELNETIFIGKLKEIDDRANIILANGAFQKKPHNDENYDVRQDISSSSKVKLHDRIVTGKHFAHNKFIVFCKNGKPYKVWTGSTNTTENGLYTQVNNAVLINDPVVAGWYFDEWNQLLKAGNDYPKTYIDYNSKGHTPDKGVTTWFAPVNAQQDMNAARTLIANAKNGILFLFFNPGTTDTLYSAIMDKYTKSTDPFFVHGIMNQDPGGKVHPLIFIHKGNQESTNYDTLMPKSINDEFSYWSSEIKPKMVTIHSKVVVIDPFGQSPIVMTGSHNDGNKASEFNDDNLNIIQNPELARQYAVNILSVYDHFHWRYSLAQNNQGAVAYKGLSTDPNWMQSYLAGNNLTELDFLLGAQGAGARSTTLRSAAGNGRTAGNGKPVGNGKHAGNGKPAGNGKHAGNGKPAGKGKHVHG